MDFEGNISFEPDLQTNYLLDSFGLETIQSPAIIRKPSVLDLSKELAKKLAKQESKLLPIGKLLLL